MFRDPPEEARWRVRALAALIVLAGLAAYANSLSGPFIFDDDASIVHNPTIRHLWAWPGPLAPPGGGGRTVEGRPVLNLSFAINYALTGGRAWSYHALNLAIHLLAGLALFGVARRTLARVAGALPEVLAFAIALLWTLHPLQTESVTYVVQRAESLMGLFYLLTLYCFIRGAGTGPVPAPAVAGTGAGGAAARRGPFPWLGLSWVACLLGMATKEVMASAPLMVLLYDRTFVAGGFREAWRRRRAFYLALGATWLVLAALVAGAGSRGGTVAAGCGVAPLKYALSQFGAVVTYLRLSIWPHPLILDYGTSWVAAAREVLPFAAVVAGLLAGSAFALFRPSPGVSGPGVPVGRALGFAGAWFFAILAPTSSLVPGNRQTIAEHRMYLPLGAVIAVLACGAYLLARRTRARPGLGAVILLAAAAALGIATAARNAAYGSALSIYAATVRDRPLNPWAHNNYGFALGDAGRAREAIGEFERALELKPDLADAHYNLGLVFGRIGRVSDALGEYEKAISLNPRSTEARYNLALLLAGQGRAAEAAVRFSEVVRSSPDFADGHVGLGNALVQLGRPADALGPFEAAVRLRPDYPEARYNLGLLLAGLGRVPEALPHLAEALRLKPDFEEGHYKFGRILAQAGMLDRALSELETAARLDPRHPEAQLDLGNVLLSLGRAPEAVARYEAALRLRPGYPEAQANLAYARSLLLFSPAP